MRRRRGTKQHSEWSRSRILILAVAFFIALGLGTLGMNAISRMSQVAAASGTGECQPKYEKCMSSARTSADQSKCETDFKSCVRGKGCEKILPAGGSGKSCRDLPDCEAHCVQAGAGGGGGITSCCQGGPQHKPPCRDKVDGKCVTKPGEGKGEPKDDKGKGDPKGEEKGKGDEKGKGEGGKPPELPKPPEKKPKEQQPQDQKCMQDPNAPECKKAQNPWYCSIPGGSLFSSKCSDNAELPHTGQTGDSASEVISDLATSPIVSPSSESGAAQPVDQQAQPTVPQGAQHIPVQQQPASEPPAAQAPSQSGGYTSPEFSGFTPPSAETPLTQEERSAAWWTLEGLRNGLVQLLSFWPW